MLDLQERPPAQATPSYAPADLARIKALLQPPAHAPAADPSIDHRVGPAPVWAPASAARIRAVEGLVIVGVMAYFAYGLGAALGLF